MIDGRTMLTGTSPFISVSAPSPKAFVYAYASGQPSDERARTSGLDELI